MRDVTAVFTVNPENPEPGYIKTKTVRKYPVLEPLSEETIWKLLKISPAFLRRMGRIEAAVSFRGNDVNLNLIYVAVPMTALEIKSEPDKAFHYLTQVTKYACSIDASVIGLGGATATGQLSKKLADKYSHRIAVTSGNGLTGYMAFQGGLSFAKEVCKTVEGISVAIIGAGGMTGSNIAGLLAQELGPNNTIYLVGRLGGTDLKPLQAKLAVQTNAQVVITDIQNSIELSSVVFTVSSSAEALEINPHWFKSGAVVVDVARPRDIAQTVAAARNDIYVLDGGVIEWENITNQTFDFDFPPKHLFACMAETAVLAIEGRRYGSFSIEDVSCAYLKKIGSLSVAMGMKPSGWRAFEKPLTQEKIQEITKNVRR